VGLLAALAVLVGATAAFAVTDKQQIHDEMRAIATEMRALREAAKGPVDGRDPLGGQGGPAPPAGCAVTETVFTNTRRWRSRPGRWWSPRRSPRAAPTPRSTTST
jgi:hypothetical protein